MECYKITHVTLLYVTFYTLAVFRSKGLATVMFKDVNSVQKVLKIKTHVIDGRNLSVEQYSKRDTRVCYISY